jgi:hypothetical protein
MELLTTFGDADLVAAQTVTPPQIPIPAPNQGTTDWGFALIVCGLVGANLWQLLQKMLVSDSDQQAKLTQALLAQNQVLLEAIVSQNQTLLEAVAKK